MSIINAALKKAARERAGPTMKTVSVDTPPARPALNRRKRWFYLLAVLLVSAGVAVSFVGKWNVLTPEPPVDTQGSSISDPPQGEGKPDSTLFEPSRSENRPPTGEEHPVGHLNAQAVAAFQRGDHEEASRLLKEALKTSPESAEAHNNLGMLHKVEGGKEEAKRQYLRALQIRPDYPEALNNLGVLLQEEGDADQARVYLQKAVDADSSYSSAHLNLAVSYESGGMKAEAFYHYRRFLDSAGVEERELVREVKKRLGN